MNNDYTVRLVDSNNSIVRTYEATSIKDAKLKTKKWKKLFPQNKVFIYTKNI